jgi:hypothetical protein
MRNLYLQFCDGEKQGAGKKKSKATKGLRSLCKGEKVLRKHLKYRNYPNIIII